jgi:hypothetical protein
MRVIDRVASAPARDRAESSTDHALLTSQARAGFSPVSQRSLWRGQTGENTGEHAVFLLPGECAILLGCAFATVSLRRSILRLAKDGGIPVAMSVRMPKTKPQEITRVEQAVCWN